MSLFDKFKVVAQNSQNTQNPKKRERESSFENIGNIEYIVPTYKLVGRYESEEHLRQDLKQYPRLVPCPKDDWHWQDKERCYQRCKKVPQECIYYRVAFYRILT